MATHPGVIVGVDATDHLYFFCPACAAPLFVDAMETEQEEALVTRIRLLCDACHTKYWRKVYWDGLVHTPQCWRTDGTCTKV